MTKQEGAAILSLRMVGLCFVNFSMVKFELTECCLNPFQPSVAFDIETSHLFCRAEQMTSFYMRHNTGQKWVNKIRYGLSK